jgi:hypothetical protein
MIKSRSAGATTGRLDLRYYALWLPPRCEGEPVGLASFAQWTVSVFAVSHAGLNFVVPRVRLGDRFCVGVELAADNPLFREVAVIDDGPDAVTEQLGVGDLRFHRLSPLLLRPKPRLPLCGPGREG